MDNIRNSELRVPSGFEVESATLHMPSGGGLEPMDSGRSMKSRVDELKVRGLDAVQSMKHAVSTRTASMRSTMATRAAGVQQEVRSNPAKWAGIVTGAGIGLGLVGRYLSYRMKQNRMPRLVIIEAC